MTEWTPEDKPCPGCGGTRAKRLGRRGGAAHRTGSGTESIIVRCRGCQVFYAKPTLLPLSNPYAGHESKEYFAVHDRDLKLEAGRLLARKAERLLGRRGRLLELGCGRGEALEAAQELGWQVRGVEMTKGFISEGVEIECAPIESAKTLEERFDVVLLAAILEHLYGPRECLERVLSALEPGGVVFIDVPNEDSLWARVANAYYRLRGRDWVVQLSPTFSPYHVVGFDPGSLRRLLEEVGFEIAELQTHRWKNELPERPGPLSRLEHGAADWVLSAGQAMGMGAGITCWARKPNDVRTATTS